MAASDFLPAGYNNNDRTVRAPAKQDEAWLSPQETEFWQRGLRHPEAFPQEFWKAVIQKVALDGEPIPQSQVVGLTQTLEAEVLAYTYTTVDVVSTTDETSLFSYDVPAGKLGAGGSLHLQMFGDMLSNGSDSIRIRAKFGGSTIIDGGTPTFTNDADRRPWTIDMKIANRGAENAQDAWIRLDMGHLTPRTVGQIGDIINTGPDAPGSLQATAFDGMAIDTTAQQTFEVTADWGAADANSSFRLRNAKLIYYPAPRIA